MAFYENTIVTKQDLAEKELQKVREKYSKLINESAGKVIKIEDWGLLNLSNKIKNYRKGFYIHYKFQGNKSTLDEIDKNIKLDGSILRHLTVKYKASADFSKLSIAEDLIPTKVNSDLILFAFLSSIAEEKLLCIFSVKRLFKFCLSPFEKDVKIVS